MSREIKFRCWDAKARFMKDDGTLPEGQPHMKYNIGLSVGKGWHTGIDGLHVRYDDPELPIMQFTGLTDNNGKEIYEGDIMDFGNNRVFYISYVGCQFVATFSERVINTMIPIHAFEIIGNIYQNPELVSIPAGSN